VSCRRPAAFATIIAILDFLSNPGACRGFLGMASTSRLAAAISGIFLRSRLIVRLGDFRDATWCFITIQIVALHFSAQPFCGDATLALWGQTNDRLRQLFVDTMMNDIPIEPLAKPL
jgi:hypothetical protein